MPAFLVRTKTDRCAVGIFSARDEHELFKILSDFDHDDGGFEFTFLPSGGLVIPLGLEVPIKGDRDIPYDLITFTKSWLTAFYSGDKMIWKSVP